MSSSLCILIRYAPPDSAERTRITRKLYHFRLLTDKTTLLNCISCFIPYDKGTISLKDVNLSKLDEKQIAKVRNEKLGFVFQDFMLLDGLTILENVCVPKVIRKEPCKQMESKAKKLLKIFGISEIAGKYPAEISGGQKQQTAVARALMNDPLLILADEPTGNLDSRSSDGKIFTELVRKGSRREFLDELLTVLKDLNGGE